MESSAKIVKQCENLENNHSTFIGINIIYNEFEKKKKRTEKGVSRAVGISPEVQKPAHEQFYMD